ncbi:hypothetical protein EJB05_31279, partial [Eragrostis curvula]
MKEMSQSLSSNAGNAAAAASPSLCSSSTVVDLLLSAHVVHPCSVDERDRRERVEEVFPSVEAAAEVDEECPKCSKLSSSNFSTGITTPGLATAAAAAASAPIKSLANGASPFLTTANITNGLRNPITPSTPSATILAACRVSSARAPSAPDASAWTKGWSCGGKRAPERRTQDASAATALTRHEARRDDGEAARGARRSGRARSGGRRSAREAARRAREAAAWAATAGWGEESSAEAASWAAAGRGPGRERRWRKKAATAWRCRAGSGTRVRSTRREKVTAAAAPAEEEAMVMRWPETEVAGEEGAKGVGVHKKVLGVSALGENGPIKDSKRMGQLDVSRAWILSKYSQSPELKLQEGSLTQA